MIIFMQLPVNEGFDHFLVHISCWDVLPFTDVIRCYLKCDLLLFPVKLVCDEQFWCPGVINPLLKYCARRKQRSFEIILISLEAAGTYFWNSLTGFST